MKEMNINPKKMKMSQKAMGKMYALSTIGAVIMAYVLYHVTQMSMNFYGYEANMAGLTSAFWMWFGFVMPVQMTEVLFGGKSWRLFAINTGYQLASMLAMGVVIGNV